MISKCQLGNSQGRARGICKLLHDITAIKGSIGSSNESENADAFSFMEEAVSEEDSGEDSSGQNVDASDEKEMPTSIPCLKRAEACQQCIPCAFKALHVYNMHVAAYNSLYTAYKCVMTLSCTQVSCERLFSKLNIVKNRLRSTMSQPNLESLLIISNEERNFPLDFEQVVDQFADTSAHLQKQLKL